MVSTTALESAALQAHQEARKALGRVTELIVCAQAAQRAGRTVSVRERLVDLELAVRAARERLDIAARALRGRPE